MDMIEYLESEIDDVSDASQSEIEILEQEGY